MVEGGEELDAELRGVEVPGVGDFEVDAEDGLAVARVVLGSFGDGEGGGGDGDAGDLAGGQVGG